MGVVMFDQNDQNQQQAQAPANEPTGVPTPDPTMTSSSPVSDPAGAPLPAMDTTGFNTTVVTPPSTDSTTDSTSTAPSLDAVPSAEPVSTEPTPVETPSTDSSMDVNMPSISTTDNTDLSTSTDSNIGGSDDLMSIKKDALQNLTPLLGQLDQSAEEKFRTTMMLIQASDDQSLIQTAYAAAKEIEDEKVRAQALLDIVNEINYFTQQAKSE